MQIIHAINIIRGWRTVLVLAMVPALVNCTRIDGSVELNSISGEPYSFEGAKVEAFDLNPAAALSGGTTAITKMPKGLGGVETDDGAITLQVITATIDDDALYDVEIRCPANNATDACNVESPLHIVLNGAQLKAGGWTATALTEIAFQNIAYYAVAAYSADQIAQLLDNNANALLLALPAGAQKTYDDLLAWNATNTDAIKRVGLVNTISESLATGIPDSDLKVLAQQAVSAELSSFNRAAYPAINGWIVHAQIYEGYAYFLGEDMPVTIVDIRDPNMIAPIGTVEGHIHSVPAVSGDFLYAMGSAEWAFDEVLYIVDISDRQHPQTTGLLELPYSPTLAASGRYVYAGTGDAINIIDTTDPTTPTVVGTLSIPNNALLVSGDRMYVTNATEISIVDISTPSTPLVVGSLSTPRPASNITTIGDYVYLTIPGAAPNDPVQLQIADISNPAAPTVTTELTLATGTRGLTVIGTRAYADTSATTQILDISNAAAPVLADSFPSVSSGIRLNDSAFFTYSGDIVSIIDSSVALQPVVQSASVPITNAVPSLVAAAGRYAYMPNRSDLDVGFQIYDLIDPLAPELITTFADGHFFSWIVLDSDYAFLIDAEFGAVETADISNPAEPFLLHNNIRLEDNQEDMYGIRKLFLSGNTLFVPWGHEAFDHGNGIGVGERGCTNTNVNGGVGGLFAIDASELQTLEIASHICMPEEARAVAASGNYAYVGVADKTLRVVDFTDTTEPALISSVNLFAPANSIALVGGYLWVTEGDSGIEIFNISTPAAPVLLTHIAVPGDTTSIEIEDNHVYVAAGLSGVHIFDIGNPMLPRLVGNVSTDLAALSAFVEGDYLYAATSVGLEIFKAFPASL